MGCGYFSSGRWADDPKNWERAWGSSKPAEVVMAHSWYWRSAHWSREEAYFFEFKWHEQLFKQFIGSNRMQPMAPDSPNPDYCFARPAWFVPKALSEYERWRCGPPGDCWLYRDKTTKDLFLYACQL